MTGFLPETPGVIKMDVLPEIRRLHFVEGVTISELAKPVPPFASISTRLMNQFTQPANTNLI